MKKNLLILTALFCFSAVSLKAQFTLRLAGGYGFPGPFNTEKVMGPKIDSRSAADDALVFLANSNDKDSSYKPVHATYGTGMNFTLGLGYMINNYIGFDLGISFLKSNTISATQVHQMYLSDPVTGYDSTGAYLNCKLTSNAIGVSLMPSIVITGAKPGWKVYPYARFGLTLPVWGGSNDHVVIDMDSAFAAAPGLVNFVHGNPYFLGKHTEVSIKNEGTVSLGINAAIGVAYKPLPYLSVFLELNGQYMNTRGKASKIEQWDADGVSKLDERGVYRTQFTYVDQLNNKSNNAAYNSNYDASKPKDDIRPFAPFSNMAVNIGLTFALSKQTLAKKPTPAAH